MTAPSPETVVLVHGLYTHGWLMAWLARQLRQAGYETTAFSYPSVRRSPADNACALARLVSGLEAAGVHYLAHSLGGLIIRHLFAQSARLPPGRIVTLGTPHRQSRAARALYEHKLRLILGRSVEHGLLGDVPPWNGKRELGSLAGTLNVGLGRIIAKLPGPSDGTVAVSETRLPGMTDHICLPVSHMSMLFSLVVATQVRAFLATGRFRHPT